MSQKAANIKWLLFRDSLSLFFERWMLGMKITIHTLLLGGFVLCAGGIFGCLVYAFLFVMPAEAFFHTYVPENYWIPAFILGSAVWGVQGIGKSRRILGEVFTEN